MNSDLDTSSPKNLFSTSQKYQSTISKQPPSPTVSSGDLNPQTLDVPQIINKLLRLEDNHQQQVHINRKLFECNEELENQQVHLKKRVDPDHLIRSVARREMVADLGKNPVVQDLEDLLQRDVVEKRVDPDHSACLVGELVREIVIDLGKNPTIRDLEVSVQRDMVVRDPAVNHQRKQINGDLLADLRL